MLTRRERTDGTWAGLGILAAGIAIGMLARPSRWLDTEAPWRPTVELAPALVPASDASDEMPEAVAALERLELVIPESSADVLQRVRDAAMERGIIVQTDADTVPAELVAGGARRRIELRIKGDWTDHVEGTRWSYRIRCLDSAYRGMREFSIQAPVTRGYLWEWVVHEAARREGVLAPRSRFVQVVQNGHPLGVYFLEEHFSKEMLESQGRREGPIVLWDESTLWAQLLVEGSVPGRGVRALGSALGEPAHSAAPAEVRAYSEKRLSQTDALNTMLHAALEQMKGLRALALVEDSAQDQRRLLEELDTLRGRTLEELVDIERLGQAHALASLFQLEHGLAWHNLRWYRDPVQGRLEPILFDAGARFPGGRDPIPFRASGLDAAFARSPRYYAALFEHLGRMLRADWVDELFEALEPDLGRYEAALAADPLGGGLPSGCTIADMKQRLRAETIHLRKACLPPDPVNFEAAYSLGDADSGGLLEVRAWATTRAPVAVEGFRFSNGGFSSAAATLARDAQGALAPESRRAHRRGSAVVLPSDGTSVLFRFPMDERLANLETVEKVTRAIRAELEADRKLDLDIQVEHRTLAGSEVRTEMLGFHRAPPEDGHDGRPVAPALTEALERHPFLRFDLARDELFALPGAHDVAGDLVLPDGVGLALGPGTTLRFDRGGVLLATGPLRFEGTTREPIVLEPKDGAETFEGIVVLGAGARSTWSDVTVRRTTAVARGGWILTGAVTFYRSPVTLVRCHFDGTEAEDGLNVFGADLLFDGVTFSGCRSDSFDGDFVTGEVRNSTFRDGLADGLDLSGSDVLVRDCRFVNLVDKACSIGERSRARIVGGEAVDVGLGVASKDDSDVEVTGMAIQARHYGLAAFVKKPEYGPARLVARDVRIADGGLGRAIAQTGCVVEIDGAAVPTQDVDVEASYEEGVLGRAK